MQKNPHFDENRVTWCNEYSGKYEPPDTGYSEQFDLQWKLGLEAREGYYDNPGASVEENYIDDRVYELTGHHPKGLEHYDESMGSRPMDHPLDVSLIRGKECIDIGCGLGRWTKTLQRIGAKSVLSIDMSNSALESVSRFNDSVLKANVVELVETHPELVERFEFAVFWGVAMCTHDPLRAFQNTARTLKPGGAMYLMVYAPEGLHGQELTNVQRRKFYSLGGVEERLSFVDSVYDRTWDKDFRLWDNLLNVSRNLRGLPKGNKVGVLDMLEPFYNWVIPWPVITRWMKSEGFEQVTQLNEYESPEKCAYHVLGVKG
jgi:SAM-dependent methyltransferase